MEFFSICLASFLTIGWTLSIIDLSHSHTNLGMHYLWRRKKRAFSSMIYDDHDDVTFVLWTWACDAPVSVIMDSEDGEANDGARWSAILLLLLLPVGFLHRSPRSCLVDKSLAYSPRPWKVNLSTLLWIFLKNVNKGCPLLSTLVTLDYTSRPPLCNKSRLTGAQFREPLSPIF